MRFLKYNRSLGRSLQEEAPATPDKISDLGILEMSWEDHLTEVWLSPLPFTEPFNVDISLSSLPPSFLSPSHRHPSSFTHCFCGLAGEFVLCGSCWGNGKL